MANPEHLALLKQGVEAWNAYRVEHPRFKPDLSNADCRNFRLANVDLGIANLQGTNLAGAQLMHADLIRANLYEASLFQANLQGAQLSQANLRKSHLGGAIFTGGSLMGADVTAAIFGWTVLGSLDLRSTVGLDAVVHVGPTSIGVESIFLSEGNLPHGFLRGAGLPDKFIDYMASLVGKAVQFYSCFISYSTTDQPFAERLHADLQAKGVRCWFAPHDVKGGRKLHEQIDDAIRLHERLLLILSPASMASEWVKTEIAKARRRELKEQRQVLFPVRLVEFKALRDWECFDADTGKDSAREIREYFIPDFSNWKDHDAYEAAFDRLLRDLQSKADPPPSAASSSAASAPTP